jgi:hypothetical protein
VEIVRVRIKDLKLYDKNAKMHTKTQLDAIIKSIRSFGFNAPVGIYGKDNLVVYGHGRVESLKEMGEKEVECVRLDHMTPEQAQEFRLVENQLNLETGWEGLFLNLELDNIIKFDMRDFGLNKKLPKIETNARVTCPECGLEFDAKGGCG